MPIIASVYRREVGQLAGAAARLLETQSPADALHAWMRLFIDYIGAKKVMAAALSAIVGCEELYASSGPPIIAAMALLVDRATAAGEIRADVEPIDLLHAVVGFSYGSNTGPDWQASALRLIDILMDGLRQHRPAAAMPR